MKLFTAIASDARLLEPFLRHYKKAGVSEFFVAVAPELKAAVEPFRGPYRITVCDGFDVADSLLAGSSAVTAMRRLHQADDEWVVIVDLDEFVEFPGPIDALAGAAERAGTTVVRGMMYDRFSYDGRTVDFPPGADLAQVYPVKSRFIRNVMGGLDYKGILVRGRLRPASAHHRFEDERLYQMLLEISHYKWVGGSIERLRANYRLAADASMPWTGEYKRALDHYDTHGRFAWEEFGGRPAEDYAEEAWDACTDCGAPVSEHEYDYSVEHFGRALCRADQKKSAASRVAPGG
jgi:hypothetical protein